MSVHHSHRLCTDSAADGSAKDTSTKTSSSAKQTGAARSNYATYTPFTAEKNELAQRRLEMYLADTTNYQVFPHRISWSEVRQTRANGIRHCLDEFEVKMKEGSRSSTRN